jgi:FkbM family methyltransferase
VTQIFPDPKVASLKLSGLKAYLYERAALRYFSKSERWQTVDILGHSIKLDRLDLEQKYLAADCVREPENLVIFRALAKSGLVENFVDIGANCGHVSLSVLNDFQTLDLFEPNPLLASQLRQMFAASAKVTIHECAIVDEASAGTLTLTVPAESSGLASLGSTALSVQRTDMNSYQVRATTLESELQSRTLSKSFVKIDVEGFEESIISSSRSILHRDRPIVGYEALSRELATACATLFESYVFYCARFDFLKSDGALTSSIGGIARAVCNGGNIEVLRLENLAATPLTNFSQIYAVPSEKKSAFENAIRDYFSGLQKLDLKTLKTWRGRSN